MSNQNIVNFALLLGLLFTSWPLAWEIKTLRAELKQSQQSLVLELGEVRGISERVRHAHNKLWRLQSTFNHQVVAEFERLGILSSTEFTLRGKVEIDQE